MSEPWNAAALQRRRWIMEHLTEAAAARVPTPTFRELSEATGAGPATIDLDLTVLQRLGYITRSRHRNGAIRVLVPFLTGGVTVTNPELAGMTGGDAGHP